ncbi:unnamed protein product [Phytophthora lilii]|uniref:Unnamed protein product n=1 Tax=Phytophthora lilii TaxID=2077276 RepID=A0A9W6WTY4_9STRA|nr:unnamed protein product [Phytophthora lilii]
MMPDAGKMLLHRNHEIILQLTLWQAAQIVRTDTLVNNVDASWLLATAVTLLLNGGDATPTTVALKEGKLAATASRNAVSESFFFKYGEYNGKMTVTIAEPSSDSSESLLNTQSSLDVSSFDSNMYEFTQLDKSGSNREEQGRGGGGGGRGGGGRGRTGGRVSRLGGGGTYYPWDFTGGILSSTTHLVSAFTRLIKVWRQAHGGGRRSAFDGCPKLAQYKGACLAHGGGRRCSVPDCNKYVQVRGRCKAHYKCLKLVKSTEPQTHRINRSTSKIAVDKHAHVEPKSNHTESLQSYDQFVLSDHRAHSTMLNSNCAPVMQPLTKYDFACGLYDALPLPRHFPYVFH